MTMTPVTARGALEPVPPQRRPVSRQQVTLSWTSIPQQQR